MLHFGLVLLVGCVYALQICFFKVLKVSLVLVRLVLVELVEVVDILLQSLAHFLLLIQLILNHLHCVYKLLNFCVFALHSFLVLQLLLFLANRVSNVLAERCLQLLQLGLAGLVLLLHFVARRFQLFLQSVDLGLAGLEVSFQSGGLGVLLLKE